MPTRECRGLLCLRNWAKRQQVGKHRCSMKQAEQHRWQVVLRRDCHRGQGRDACAVTSAILDDMDAVCWRRATLPLESMATSARIVEHRGAGGLARVSVCSKRRGA